MNSNSFMRVQFRIQKKYFIECKFGENDRVQRVRVRSPDKNCPSMQCAPPTVTNVFKKENINIGHKKYLNTITKYTKLNVFKYK